MKKKDRKAELKERKRIEWQLLDRLRQTFEKDYKYVRLVWFHSRRQKSKWLCDGEVIILKGLDSFGMKLPQISPEELDLDPEHYDMFG